ncbi:GNAT family N-acetyltransferase [[Pseudomonas] boreopolis]|uniref:N-acetyltransferase n=1 Tax=Xanthomonas boreopolis TaxID=86183 RepID=A0A919KGL5_9XANT|nr:N-acetyltransferase [[Pseudomonas] boreopolis]
MNGAPVDILLRPERPEDAQAIEVVTLVAFMHAEHSRHTEQDIIAALRADGALAVSLVAEHEGYVVGHAAASPVTVSDGARGWYGLGPVSVGPGHQRRGIGSRLVGAVLDALREQGASGCVVLGEPAFYGRFGFAQEPDLVLPGVPAAYFQALAFGDRLPPMGEVEYHPAFSR